jgi:hypothetical protein
MQDEDIHYPELEIAKRRQQASFAIWSILRTQSETKLHAHSKSEQHER